MNFLAQMWAERERKRREMAELREVAREVHEGFERIEPLRRELEKRHEANLRQSGRDGFVMVFARKR